MSCISFAINLKENGYVFLIRNDHVCNHIITLIAIIDGCSKLSKRTNKIHFYQIMSISHYGDNAQKYKCRLLCHSNIVETLL